MKIVYCTDSICYPGGIQRITVAKANALAEIKGNEVWIVVTDNKLKPVLPLNPKVHLVDLNVNYFMDDWKSRWHVLKSIFIKRIVHKKKLRNLLRNIRPDVVISTGTSEKNFLPHLRGHSPVVFVREIHSIKNYRRSVAKGLIDKVLAWLGECADYGYNIKRYDKIVLLTSEDRNRNWNNDVKTEVIPNPLTIKHDILSSLENKTVIAVGRLVSEKNFSSLISAWKDVYSVYPDWHLEIWGEGQLKHELKCLIVKLQLAESVYLKGYTDDIMKNYAKASIFVCSSNFEGFGLALVEAMSCGLPVVSYDCPCGPRDIITEGKDGFLVPMGDEKALAERICYLIEHDDERRKMGKAALEKSKQYAMDIIIDKWMNLFKNLMGKSKR